MANLSKLILLFFALGESYSNASLRAKCSLSGPSSEAVIELQQDENADAGILIANLDNVTARVYLGVHHASYRGDLIDNDSGAKVFTVANFRDSRGGDLDLYYLKPGTSSAYRLTCTNN